VVVMEKTEWAAWAAAAFFFFGGDILTTLVGMQMGFVEMNPLNHLLFDLVGPLPGLITVKAIVCWPWPWCCSSALAGCRSTATESLSLPCC